VPAARRRDSRPIWRRVACRSGLLGGLCVPVIEGEDEGRAGQLYVVSRTHITPPGAAPPSGERQAPPGTGARLHSAPPLTLFRMLQALLLRDRVPSAVGVLPGPQSPPVSPIAGSGEA